MVFKSLKISYLYIFSTIFRLFLKETFINFNKKENTNFPEDFKSNLQFIW
jgi:hypothetical protein